MVSKLRVQNLGRMNKHGLFFVIAYINWEMTWKW